MAKQRGPMYVWGTIFGITHYKMGGKYYARTKTSLNKQRLLRDPAFARFLECSGIFRTASKMATELYRKIPKERRYHNQRQKMTGSAFSMLRKGRKAEKVMAILHRRHVEKWVIIETPKSIQVADPVTAQLTAPPNAITAGTIKYVEPATDIKPSFITLSSVNIQSENEYLSG